VKLFEHPDFEQAILRAADHFRGQGWRPAIIEKDYFVTEALRIIDRISRACFPKSYFHPDGMSFARSDALFPAEDLAAVISAEYEAQCRLLCYGPYPSWAEIQDRLLALRDLL